MDSPHELLVRIIFKKVKIQLKEILKVALSLSLSLRRDLSFSNLNWLRLFLSLIEYPKTTQRLAEKSPLLLMMHMPSAHSCTFQVCLNGYTFQTYLCQRLSGPP